MGMLCNGIEKMKNTNGTVVVVGVFKDLQKLTKFKSINIGIVRTEQNIKTNSMIA